MKNPGDNIKWLLPKSESSFCLLFDYKGLFFKSCISVSSLVKIRITNLNVSPRKALLYPVYISSIKQIMHACLAKYTGTHKQTSNYLAVIAFWFRLLLILTSFLFLFFILPFQILTSFIFPTSHKLLNILQIRTWSDN